MSNTVDSKAVTISVKIYERLLALCPTDFRREYGPAMKQLFRDQCRDAWSEAQGRGLAVLWLRALPDLAKTSLVQHFANRADARPRAAFTKWFAMVFVCTFGFSICQMFWTPKVFSSTARIEVQKAPPLMIPVAEGRGNPYFLANQFEIIKSYSDFLTTQPKIIESYSVLTNVIATLHLDDKLATQSGGTGAHWTMDQTYAALYNNISVRQTRMPSLIEISVKNGDPKLAADIANAIVDAYRDSRLKLWHEEQFSGIDALQARMSEQEMRQGIMEASLKEMRAALKISDSDEEVAVASKNQPYFSLKRKIEELRRNNEDLNRMIQREKAELSPPSKIVAMRDRARPIPFPVQSQWEIFSRWMFGGTVAALVVGGAGACLTYSIRRPNGIDKPA